MTQLDRIRVARGGKRPETSDEWERYQQDKLVRRAKNVANARQVLDRNEIKFIDYGKVNGNVQFVIKTGVEELWYWPETGLWFNIEQKQPQQRFGIRNLVRHLKGELK